MSVAASINDRWGPHADSLAGRTLVAMLEAQRLPHALLIAGPIGVGKRDLAVRIAQSLLCDSADPRDGGPCRECRDCRRLHDPLQPKLDPQHTDVEIITPGSLCAESDHDHSNTRTIGICIIRRIEHVATLAPFEADQRVIIINPAEALSPDAADAFLKTLEEPPERVHFILLTSQEEQLSETIRSRCRIITLAPLPSAQLNRWLEHWAAAEELTLPDDPERRSELGRLARGRPGWLQSNLRDGDPVALRAAQIDDAVRIAEASRAERLNWSEQVVGRFSTSQTLANLELILEAWTDWWRDLWLQQTNQQAAVVHVTQLERIERLAGLYDQEQVSQFLEKIQRTRALIERGVTHGLNARLALDVLLLNIPVPLERS
jgi:DNA polymerase-3 subunit delta'